MPDVTTANTNRTDSPDRGRGRSNEWVLCGHCRAVLYRKRWIKLNMVCPQCGHHGRLDAAARLWQLADPGSVELIEIPQPEAEDPLVFVDRMPYPARLAQAREATGLTDSVLIARAEIDGVPAVVAVMDFGFLGGSLGVAAGDALTRAAEKALTRRLPFVVVTASGGARMQEGAVSLMQMARTATSWTELREAGLLTVTVVTDPTYGGVAASFASLSDVIVGEKGARLGFAGRRVIEQTIREKLPSDFQTVEFMMARGFVDVVVPRDGLRDVLGRLLRCSAAPSPPGTGARQAPGDLLDRNDRDGGVLRDPAALPRQDAAQQVRRARELTRPTMLDYLNLAFDEHVELHGDRAGGDCPAMIAALARLRGRPVVVIGQQKGHTAVELAERRFGMPSPAGYRKAARAMRLAAALRIPVVTLVDTPGAFPGAAAEEQGQASAIAENLQLMMTLPIPVVSVVTGEGGSGGALGIAVANRVLAWQSAVYSVISPEGCASILWGDSAQVPVAAAALKLTSRDLLELGVLDGVLPEPEGGVGSDPLAAAERLAESVGSQLAELGGLDADQLIKDRRRRFGRFGAAHQG